MEEIFIQLAVILLTAFLVSYIIRLFNQPIIIGYIIAGMIISPFILKFGASTEVIHLFSKFGIAFLLFIVGLHLNPKIIKEIGATSLFIGISQMVLTFILGFLISFYLMSFNYIASIFVGVALMFSSTIIVMKLLSDERQLDSLYGKISIGILIVQDLVAIFALILISSLGGEVSFTSFAIQGLMVGGGAIITLFLFGFFVLPFFTKSIARSQELLFLFSICWCFLIAGIFNYLGFSIEIGALMAGVVLSISPYSTEISAKIRPLRDFFLVIFFIILGLEIPLASLNSVIIFNALILSSVAIIFKPLILMMLTAVAGYTKRTNFLVGTTLGQISEFSIIVLLLTATIPLFATHISNEVFHTIILTLIITIFISTYMIIYSNGFYKLIQKPVSIFERKNAKKQKEQHKKYDAILFGYNRIGFGILHSLKKIKKNYLVVDFNPDTVSNLKKLRIPCLYGDVDDPDLLEDLPLEKLQLAVSTIPDFETNILLIETIRRKNPKAIIIVRAHEIQNALALYREGADYVLTPHFLGGEYISKMIEDLKTNEKKYVEEKHKHIKMLTKRLEKGHRHPEVERE